MSSYLYRLASFAYRRRRLVLGLWLVAAIAAIAIAQASGGKTNDTFSIPGTESQNAAAVLTAKLPAFSGGQTSIVFATANGTGTGNGGTAKVTDPAEKTAIESAMVGLKSIPQVSAVTTPFQSKLISPSGTIALGTVQWSAPATSVPDASLNAVKAAMQPLQAKGVQVEYNGSVYPGWRVAISETPELIGIAIAFIIRQLHRPPGLRPHHRRLRRGL
jgi:putative drug exporter of the RND superfamily